MLAVMIFHWLAITGVLVFSFKVRLSMEESKANCECEIGRAHV